MEVSTVILALKRAGLRLSLNSEKVAERDRTKKAMAWEIAAQSVIEDLSLGYDIAPKSDGSYGPR